MTQQDSKGLKTAPVTLQGVTEPRIWTKSPDLPSYGIQFIEFCESMGITLLPWQMFLAHEILKVNEDDTWHFMEVGCIVSRQNGKSTFMQWMILWRMFELRQKLQIHTAHKLNTAAEIFWKVEGVIGNHLVLAEQSDKTYQSRGFQEIKLKTGERYLVRANNSAARGLAAPETIYMDEVREYMDDEAWASLRFTQMASANPQTIIFSNAGHQHSIILNRLRERGIAAAAGGNDPIGWFEWSAEPGCPIMINDEPNWPEFAKANPSLGYTINKNNLRMAMNDEESIIRTEVLCQWVETINPAIAPASWHSCKGEVKLSKEENTWFAIDLSPNRQEGALVAAQIQGDKFVVALLATFNNPVNIDDKQMANEVAEWVRKYPVETVAYSRQTAGAVAARLAPAGISTTPIDGALYGQACDEMLSAITSGRLIHGDQEELTRQALSAVKLPFKDGGWYLGRKVSNTTICATVAMAMVSHFATRPDTEVDIVLG